MEDESPRRDESLKDCLKHYTIIAFDTEFPGFIFRTPRHASEKERYRDMKLDVEGTKLIQFGFTLFNTRGEIGDTWKVNFSNFGEPSDACNEASMAFLAHHGLDLKKIREDGINMFESGFFVNFFNMLRYQNNIQWVTFHGSYDLAYVMSILNMGLGLSWKLPPTFDEFADDVGRVFGVVHDLKVIARSFDWFGDHFGLENMAQRLHVQRIGRAHHADSDNLLGAFIFIEINRLCVDAKNHAEYLYGMRRRVIPTRSTVRLSYGNVIYSGYPNYDLHVFYYNYPLYFNPRTIYNGVSAANTWYSALPYMAQRPNAYHNLASYPCITR